MKARKLTQARLRDCLHYDPETGAFTWVKAISKKVKVGRLAGWRDKRDGRTYIRTKSRWLATIVKDGKQLMLARTGSLLDAVAARLRAERELFPFSTRQGA